MIVTADGVQLEARWDRPDTMPVGCVVFCHPHPLDGGTMNAPLMKGITRVLVRSGLAVLRFNFRGVGGSRGTWGGGDGEVIDVAAAVAAAAGGDAGTLRGIAGWSFGATTSLRWQAESGSTVAWAGIAPGIRPYRGAAPPDVTRLAAASRLIVLGDRDQFATPGDMTEYAAAIGARLELLAGSDHFFHFREQVVGRLIAEHFGAATPPADRTTQVDGGR
ncbi:MAG TPA: alpha/beta family hydrolase [Acidimicrobiia bacterium]|nr:alpha/beta family hydrolase [Acidimicrobiia bacterium]